MGVGRTETHRKETGMKRKQKKDVVLSIFAPMVRGLIKACAMFMAQSKRMQKADELGALLAAVGPMNARIKELKEKLWEQNPRGARVVGELFEANLFPQPFKYVDAEKVRIGVPERVEEFTSESVRHMCDVHAITGKED